MRKILPVFVLMFSIISFAQLPQSLITPVEKIFHYKEYDGSIYEKSRFSNATVIDEKSGSYDANLRYNIHTDALEYENSTGLYEVIKTQDIHARIDNNYYYYCQFRDQRDMKKDGYYILVELNKNYRVYKKRSLRFQESSKTNTSFNDANLGKIWKTTTYFLEQENIIMELPMSKKEILIAFSDKKKELENYIKSEKIRMRKEDDLIRLVSRYNALKNNDSHFASKSLLSNSDTMSRD